MDITNDNIIPNELFNEIIIWLIADFEKFISIKPNFGQNAVDLRIIRLVNRKFCNTVSNHFYQSYYFDISKTDSDFLSIHPIQNIK